MTNDVVTINVERGLFRSQGLWNIDWNIYAD